MLEAFIATSIVLLVWALYANRKTLNQRLALIPEPKDPLFHQKIKVFGSVSYDKHYWYVITFRNAYALYEVHNET